MAKKDDFKTKILNNFKDAIATLAEDVTFQIESAYETAISMFYKDYDPLYYDRTYSTYLGSDKYDDPFGYQHYGDSYFSGIGVSASYIPGNPYNAYKEWVFNRTYYKGIHGFNKSDKDRVNKTRTKENAWRIKHVPRTMTQKPSNLMKKSFKSITKKSNMDKLLNQAIEKALR